MTTTMRKLLSEDQLAHWEREGYLIVPGMMADRVDAMREHYDAIAARGEPIPGHWNVDPDSDDPLKRYPRLMHPHRFEQFSLDLMLHPTVGQALEDLMGEPAVACQSMLYYKPPQSPGQSLHQDNFYLAVKPGTCIAAWTAIDRARPENGGMYVVPGTHKMDIHCPDPEQFKAGKSNLVDPPKGMKAVPAILDPGDTLFFNGSLIHGSGRNKSETEWRRAFIAHYMPRGSTHVNPGYFPIHDFDGNEITYAAADAGGPCGDRLKGVANTYGVDAVIY